MTFTHYTNSEGKTEEISKLHSARLRNTSAKLRREHAPGEMTVAGQDAHALADHMDSVAHTAERKWHDEEPEKYAEWAAKNPEKHADFQARHFPKTEG